MEHFIEQNSSILSGTYYMFYLFYLIIIIIIIIYREVYAYSTYFIYKNYDPMFLVVSPEQSPN